MISAFTHAPTNEHARASHNTQWFIAQQRARYTVKTCLRSSDSASDNRSVARTHDSKHIINKHTSLTSTSNTVGCNSEALGAAIFSRAGFSSAMSATFTKKVLKAGDGPKPHVGAKVTVHAKGQQLINGEKKQFWDTHDAGQKPFSYEAGKGKVRCRLHA
jgi:FKBP-type peptidyl-prolyl cis-trans isomerase